MGGPEVRQTWVKLSASEEKLDTLRPDGIHIKRDGTGRITHAVIFEITRANDLFAKFWGEKVATKSRELMTYLQNSGGTRLLRRL